jgi:hypothetical protein
MLSEIYLANDRCDLPFQGTYRMKQQISDLESYALCDYKDSVSE